MSYISGLFLEIKLLDKKIVRRIIIIYLTIFGGKTLFFDDTDSVMNLFSKIQRLKFFVLRKELNTFGVHPAHVPLFFIIQKNPGISQKDIAKTLAVSPATVAIMLRKMEKNGLVKRDVNLADRREYQVFLTKKSELIIKRLEGIIEKFEKISISSLSEDEVNILKAMLKKIIKNLEAYKDV